jgi:hypothetical protein
VGWGVCVTNGRLGRHTQAARVGAIQGGLPSWPQHSPPHSPTTHTHTCGPTGTVRSGTRGRSHRGWVPPRAGHGMSLGHCPGGPSPDPPRTPPHTRTPHAHASLPHMPRGQHPTRAGGARGAQQGRVATMPMGRWGGQAPHHTTPHWHHTSLPPCTQPTPRGTARQGGGMEEGGGRTTASHPLAWPLASAQARHVPVTQTATPPPPPSVFFRNSTSAQQHTHPSAHTPSPLARLPITTPRDSHSTPHTQKGAYMMVRQGAGWTPGPRGQRGTIRVWSESHQHAARAGRAYVTTHDPPPAHHNPPACTYASVWGMLFINASMIPMSLGQSAVVKGAPCGAPHRAQPAAGANAPRLVVAAAAQHLRQYKRWQQGARTGYRHAQS